MFVSFFVFFVLCFSVVLGDLLGDQTSVLTVALLLEVILVAAAPVVDERLAAVVEAVVPPDLRSGLLALARGARVLLQLAYRRPDLDVLLVLFHNLLSQVCNGRESKYQSVTTTLSQPVC